MGIFKNWGDILDDLFDKIGDKFRGLIFFKFGNFGVL